MDHLRIKLIQIIQKLILKPHTKFIDPFVEEGVLVMCDSYDVDGNPIETNNRYFFRKMLLKKG